MKRIISALLLICVLLCPFAMSSCGSDTVFSLGKYKIEEDHYRYLASIHNRKQYTAYGLSLSTPYEATFSSGLTVAQMLDSTQQDFLNDIYMLLLSQLLFDVYELELPDEMADTIDANVDTVIYYYGGYSEQKFDKRAKDAYGFTASTIREVYTMQMKQTLVIEHLYGQNGEKIDPERLDELYRENYFCFQTIVINNVYKLVKETNNEGEETSVMTPLTDIEIKERNDIIDDLTNLFIEPVDGYEYKVIDPTKSYEELYALYSDDKAYPQGCYSPYPSNVASQNAITAAALLKENDVAKVKANRFFSQGGTFNIGSEKITINAGDYFTYGSVFVKRLPLGEKPYEKNEYKDFFEQFISIATSVLFTEHLADFEKNESNYKIEDHGIYEDIALSSIAPNDLDYNLIYGEDNEESDNE